MTINLKQLEHLEYGNDIYLRPSIANKIFQKAKSSGKTIYICGMSGSGKTVFIKDCLRRRKHYYFSCENLKAEDLQFSQGGSIKTIVVIDDLQVINVEDGDKIIRQKIVELVMRRDVWLVLAGRCQLPLWLIPQFFKDVFIVIEEEHLRLTPKEHEEYFSQWELYPTEDILRRIYDFTKGVGILEKITAVNICQGCSFDRKLVLKLQNIYLDYMEYQIFEHWDRTFLELIVQISLVDSFTIPMAEEITGRNDVAQMLQYGEAIDDFIIRLTTEEAQTVFEFKTFIRQIMERRLYQHYDMKKRTEFYYNAGLYYELKGDIPQALEMYEQCKDDNLIAQLLITNARIRPGAAPYYELRHYYLSLEEVTIKSNAELMVGMSMLQSLLMNIEESERWYRELENYAHTHKVSESINANKWLIYLDIALPHRKNDNLISMIEEARVYIESNALILPEISITDNLPSIVNGGGDYCEWCKCDRQLLDTIGEHLEFILGRDGKGIVNLILAESLFEKGEDNYEVQSLANCGWMQAEAGGRIEQCFVAIGILVWLNIFSQKGKNARGILTDFRKKVVQENKDVHREELLDSIDTLLVRISMYYGQIADVETWITYAPNEDIEFYTLERYRYLTKIRAYLMFGMNEQALSLIQRMVYYAQKMNRTYIYIEATLLLAIVQRRMKNNLWKESFQECLEKAEEYHFVRVISREGIAVKELLKEGEWTVNDTAFYAQMCEEIEIMSRSYPGYLKTKKSTAEFPENALWILKHQAEGLTSGKIAELLGIKESTVKYHCRENYKKLGVKTKAAAVTEARRRRLI